MDDHVRLSSLLLIGLSMLAGCAPPPPSPPPPAPASFRAAAPPPGQVTLAWDAPDERLSGETLPARRIAGYRIYYGDAPNEYTRWLDVDPTTEHVISGLIPGRRYYFSIAAIDDSGRVGERSPPLIARAVRPES